VLRKVKRLLKDESGAELVEWIIVTVILSLAIFAILQLIGDDLKAWYQVVLEWITNIVS